MMLRYPSGSLNYSSIWACIGRISRKFIVDKTGTNLFMWTDMFSSKNLPYTLTLAIGIALMLVFAFTDLAIARRIYTPESRFGNFLADYGELPAFWLLLVAAFAILLYSSTIFTKLLIVPVIGIELLIVYDDVVKFTIVDTLIVLVLLLPITFLALWGLSLMSRHEKANSSKYILWTGLLHPLIIVQSIKTLWGRIRFRNLENLETDFTPWYLPQGITGEQSFPSGHAAMGIMMVFLTLYMPKKYKPIVFGLTFVWAISVSLSRMIVGAHFASDVTFSLLVGMLFYIFFSKRLHLSMQQEIYRNIQLQQ